MTPRPTDKSREDKAPRPGQTVRFQGREWRVITNDCTPWASRVGDQFLAHVRFVTLVSIAGPSAEISLPESEWHLMRPVE